MQGFDSAAESLGASEVGAGVVNKGLLLCSVPMLSCHSLVS
jgi:hypothetical protein